MDTTYKTTLELDKVLARAVQLCACQETKEMMQALQPAPTVEDERYDLAQTNAINALLIKNGSPRFGSVREVRRIVAHAHKGGILSMGELLEIAATLRNFSGLSQWYGLSEHEMLPTDDLFFALAPQPVLEKQISESILSPEEMADTASVTLHDLRRKIRQTEDSIRTKLDNIIRNSTTNKFLQDAVVSLRNGRYVVPVRAEYRGEVGGVIHDVSSTGATVFVEPTAVVEANARIMQLRAQEQEEITRILTSFSTQVASLEPQFSYSYDAMLKIDLLLAKARLAVEQNAFMPAVSDTICFRLNKARHPLIDKKKVVPVDISLGSEYDTLVITGPNTGGKTVSLKTVLIAEDTEVRLDDLHINHGIGERFPQIRNRYHIARLQAVYVPKIIRAIPSSMPGNDAVGIYAANGRRSVPQHRRPCGKMRIRRAQVDRHDQLQRRDLQHAYDLVLHVAVSQQYSSDS